MINQETKKLVDKLKERDDVLGVLMFGSWARGNNRENSDIDLLVILQDGYKRCIEREGSQIFEIIYTTSDKAISYWKENKDDCANLWEAAYILHEKDEVMSTLKGTAQEILKDGKSPLNESEREQRKFDAYDQIRACKDYYSKGDKVQTLFILTNKVFDLTKTFFDIRQMWTPAPKLRLKVIEEESSELYNMLTDFYSDTILLEEKISIAEDIVDFVFR